MVRYVYYEFWAALAMLFGSAVGVAVAVGVRDETPVRSDGVPLVAAVALGFLVVSALLRSSRLKWFGDVREFEAAVPRPHTGATPPNRTYTVWLVALFVFAALLTSFVGDVVILPVVMGLDWLAKTVVGARWERRNGRVLWRGHDREEPWKLSYAPVSPPRATRTATDAPPA